MTNAFEGAVKEIFNTAAALGRSTALNQAWREVNALDAMATKEDALAIIEKLGGMDPALRSKQ